MSAGTPIVAVAKVDPAKNSFTKSAAEIRRGSFMTECSEKLHEVTHEIVRLKQQLDAVVRSIYVTIANETGITPFMVERAL